tara:strand:- start:225 stop:620 length:396 start_codon:yes stop_codon:yes gene_type:complete
MATKIKKPTPADPKLYEKVKKQIYKKYPKHSAYRSGMVVQKYKKKFAEIYGHNKNPYIGKYPTNKGLDRWFKENWKSDTNKYKYTSSSSVYRPTKRITKNTPTTFKELSDKQIKRAKREKSKKGRVKKFNV